MLLKIGEISYFGISFCLYPFPYSFVPPSVEFRHLGYRCVAVYARIAVENTQGPTQCLQDDLGWKRKFDEQSLEWFYIRFKRFPDFLVVLSPEKAHRVTIGSKFSMHCESRFVRRVPSYYLQLIGNRQWWKMIKRTASPLQPSQSRVRSVTVREDGTCSRSPLLLSVFDLLVSENLCVDDENKKR